MSNTKEFIINRGMAIRLAADAAMINLAILAALSIRFFLFVVYDGAGPRSLELYVGAYLQNALPLTLVCLTTFWLNGFYTYGRAYQGRFKVLIITQAVLLSYLIYGVLTYLTADRLQFIEIPRGALLLACGLTWAIVVASRTWTFLWETMVRTDREKALKQQGDKVRRVLVIGGAGYIGSALLPKLVNAGFRVRILDRFIYGTDPIAEFADHGRVELLQGDFRNVDEVVKAMQDVDAVVHLGAIVGDPACELDHDVTIHINLVATQMIAQVAKANGIRRFIFASTCSVYGASDQLLDERSEVRPVSLYGETKLAAERGLRNMSDSSFSPTIIRFATIYGFSGRTRFDLVVNLLAAKAKMEGVITVNGGDQWRPFVHVDDAALGIFKVLTSPILLVGDQIFNIGSDAQNKTIAEIGELVADYVPGAEVRIDREASDRRNYRVSFQKVAQQLGFEPRWSLEAGIRQVIEAVVEGQVEDYQEAQYSNVKFLRDTGAIDTMRITDTWVSDLNQLAAPPDSSLSAS